MSASSKKKFRKEQEAAMLTEKQQQEKKEAKKLKTYTTVFVVILAAVIAFGLFTLVATLYNNSGIAERNTIALTVGEHDITTAELSYFYIDSINNAYSQWYNSYGNYTATYLSMLYGLDLTKPLNQQMYNEEANETWADFFVDEAVNQAVNVYTMYDQAVAAGQKVSDEDMANIDTTLNSLDQTSANYGYGSTKEYLQAFYGKGASLDTYRNYLEVIALSSAYEQANYDGFTYEQSDLDAYDAEHHDEFSSFSYCTYQFYYTDFLVCTAEEGDTEHKHTDEEINAALKAAEEAANGILEGKPTTAIALNKAINALEAYAKKETPAECIEYNASRYTAINDEDIKNWLNEDGRVAGDMTLITNSNTTTADDGTTTEKPYAYTLVLFLERHENDMEMVNIRHILSSFSGGTTDANGKTTYTDAEKAAAKEVLEALQESWLAGGGTEDLFSNLAKANSTDSGSASNGGLYTDVYPGQMVTPFNDWCFDPAREVGDYGIVETEYGYHLIYFSSRTGTTYRNYMIENTLRNADFDEWYKAIIDAAKYTVHDTSKLNLSISFSN